MSCLGLFSGCGGLDVGFQSAGFNIDLAVDNDPLALKTHALNLKSPTAILDLASEIPNLDHPVDVLLAGPPCQGFSTLGRRDPTDPRNELLKVPSAVASAVKPRFVVLENVPGTRAGVHAKHLDASAEALRALGYKVATIEVEMHEFSVPQRRRRVLQLAWLGDGEFRLSLPNRPQPTLGASLEGVASSPDHEPIPLGTNTRSARIARHIRQGQKLCNVRVSPSAVRSWSIPEVFGAVSSTELQGLEGLVRLRRRNRKRSWGDADPVSARELTKYLGFPSYTHLQRLVAAKYVRRIDDRYYDISHTFNGKYRRPQASGLAPAVDTRFGDAHYVLHPTEQRAFTVREAARIQGFRDSFSFQGTRREQYRQIANAVPPPMAEALATSVRGFLSGGSP